MKALVRCRQPLRGLLPDRELRAPRSEMAVVGCVRSVMANVSLFKYQGAEGFSVLRGIPCVRRKKTIGMLVNTLSVIVVIILVLLENELKTFTIEYSFVKCCLGL